ncbi:hypothetical protein ACJMK2_006865 [Sinanodonta woodiana]|uniref:Uncharacterized protein n=1 Tax=Sinanodonta woodiana TaxID=1069815 RepID=A0ABD3VUH7_SINWO
MPRIIDLTCDHIKNVKFEYDDIDNRDMIKEIRVGRIDIHELQVNNTCDILTVSQIVSNPINVHIQTKKDDKSTVELNKDDILAIGINKKDNEIIDFSNSEINYIKEYKTRAKIAELVDKIDSLKGMIDIRDCLIRKQNLERVRLSKDNWELKNQLFRYERPYLLDSGEDTASGCELGFKYENEFDDATDSKDDDSEDEI